MSSITDTSGTTPAPQRAGNEHPMISIPFSAVIDGRRHTGNGLSLVEAQVSGLIDPALQGETRLVHLVFDFPGFRVVLEPEAWIEKTGEETLSMHFTDPSGAHHAQLRKILNDYISGDLTTTGSLIRSGSLTQPRGGQAPATSKGGSSRLKSLLSGIAVLALFAVLLGIAGLLVQDRLLTTGIDTPGHLVPAGQTIRATADGQISYLDAQAAEGDILFAIQSSSGETLSIAMPCACEVRNLGVAEGSTVLAGEPVLALSDAESGLVLAADVPRALLYDIQVAGGIEAKLPSGETFTASLADFPTLPPQGADDTVHLQLQPDRALPDSLAGQFASLTVASDALAPAHSLFAGARDAGRAASESITGLWADHVQPHLPQDSANTGDLQ